MKTQGGTDTQDTTPNAVQDESTAAAKRRRIAATVSALVAAVFALAFLGLYGIERAGGKRTAHAGVCAQSLDLASAVDPLVHGEIAALTLASSPHQLGRISFDDGAGMKTTLASFSGKTVLLNLWATWCVPCRSEMPSLDKLQADLGSGSFTVVPVNIDTVRLEKPRAFLKEIGATSLPFYADPTADILQNLKSDTNIVGLPTTILIGRDGCEIGTMAGPAEWDSPDAKALIRRLEQPAATRAQT